MFGLNKSLPLPSLPKRRYTVEATYLGDWSSDEKDYITGAFGPFSDRATAERCCHALASQPAQHFWAIVGATIVEHAVSLNGITQRVEQ